MDLRTPPLNALRAFDAIVRTRSISEAAKALRVTQSAISQQQKSLEIYLGVRLFNREGKQLRLTETGTLYAKYINSMFDNLRLATTQLLHSHSQENVITVNTDINFASEWIIPRLSYFQKLHPTIEFRLSTPVIEVDFQACDIDAGIYYSEKEKAWPELESIKLFTLEKGNEIIPWKKDIKLPGAIYLVYPREVRGKRNFLHFKNWILAEVEKK